MDVIALTVSVVLTFLPMIIYLSKGMASHAATSFATLVAFNILGALLIFGAFANAASSTAPDAGARAFGSMFIGLLVLSALYSICWLAFTIHALAAKGRMQKTLELIARQNARGGRRSARRPAPPPMQPHPGWHPPQQPVQQQWGQPPSITGQPAQQPQPQPSSAHHKGPKLQARRPPQPRFKKFDRR